MSNNLESRASRAEGLQHLRFIPEGTPEPQRATFREAFLAELGIEWDVYKQFASVANMQDCLILIRKTNQGVIYGLGQGRNVTGKTLSTKGKSSEYAPIRSNLAFFSSFAKSNVKSAAEYRDGRPQWESAAYWQGIANEQASLLDVVRGDHAMGMTANGQSWPEQFFIPKVAPWGRVKEQCGLTASAPPDWVALRIRPSYEAEVWTAADGKPFPAVEAGAGVPPPVDFLWVKVGELAKVDTAFQAASQLLAEEYKNRSPAKADWKFTGTLAPDQSVPGDDPNLGTYYRLYVRTATLPQLSGRAMAQQAAWWAAADTDRSKLLDAFAPQLISGPPTTGLPGHQGNGQPNTEWRALSVLGQAKVPLDERNRATGQHVSYYEIIADYDVFCIAPPLISVYGMVSGIHGRSQVNLQKYFPHFTSDQGLVTDFERDVKTAINQSAAGTGWRERVYTGVAESMLHGCEVNNIFYTEAFDDLIFVVPHAWQRVTSDGGAVRDSDECPRFRFSTGAYLDLLRTRTLSTPAATRGAFNWPEWREANSEVPTYWLPHLNLMWGARVDAGDAQAQALLFDTDVRRDPGSPELDLTARGDWTLIKKYLRPMLTPAHDLGNARGLGMEATRLWYYAGLYRTIFLELGKYYDYSIHAIENASAGMSAADVLARKEAAQAKLLRARSVLRAALALIREAAEELREASRLALGTGQVRETPRSLRAQASGFDPGPHALEDLQTYIAASPTDPHWVTLLRNANWIAPSANPSGEVPDLGLLERLVRVIMIWDTEVGLVQADWGHHDLEREMGGGRTAASASTTAALPEVAQSSGGTPIARTTHAPAAPPVSRTAPPAPRFGPPAPRPAPPATHFLPPLHPSPLSARRRGAGGEGGAA